jgi:hypothetical protein
LEYVFFNTASADSQRLLKPKTSPDGTWGSDTFVLDLGCWTLLRSAPKHPKQNYCQSSRGFATALSDFDNWFLHFATFSN